ncbi:minor histocompatibility antigen H13 [Alternaria panax]|uniref:Minor histocompatibility antigen H13 n=1 Tax=Alternaria panax TaxID=48097 RepID=A0AAD4I6T8_9PLEO|nr:minor histocompatibility antigen H13 [Alternaria panax]
MADSEPSLVAVALGNAAYAFSKVQPLLPVYTHLILACLFPIYAAAHASLTRPSTAAKRTRQQVDKTRHGASDDDTDSDDDDDDDDDEDSLHTEAITNKDIILFPLFAGIALSTFYLVIKWLGDATMLNKILNAYFAMVSVPFVTNFISDILDSGHSFIFPRRHALAGTLYHVHAPEAKAMPVAADMASAQPLTTPLPGFLARIPLPASAKEWLWADRAMPSSKWTLKLFWRRALAGQLRIGPHTVVGAVTALSALLYFNLVDKTWYLTNLLGMSASYTSMQLFSPATFTTGSGLLVALFFYDIYMVFFTPLMETVAMSLDVPAMLKFPEKILGTSVGAKQTAAAIGTGDIVIPGVVIAMALRFDFYLFYLRRQKRVTATTEGGEDSVEKTVYYPMAGRWSDAFWTHSFMGRPLFTTANVQVGDKQAEEEPPFTFPKVYFHATLVGYVVGLIITIFALRVMGRSQPALLWLVPSVLVALWGTALVRGELGLMWNYTEEIVEEEGENRVQTRTSQLYKNAGNEDKKPARGRKARPEREVFSFSLEAPRKARKTVPPKSDNAEVEVNGVTAPAGVAAQTVDEGTFWAGSTSNTTARQEVDVEPAGKRLRVR